MLLMAPMAQAQYVWVDAKGVKQFSDRAPPGSVPLKRILKSPARLKDPVDAEASIGATTGLAKAPPATTWVEREADHRKIQTDKDNAGVKVAQASADEAQRQARCNSARSVKAQLATGRRLRNDDRSTMDEDQKAEQSALADTILSQCN